MKPNLFSALLLLSVTSAHPQGLEGAPQVPCDGNPPMPPYLRAEAPEPRTWTSLQWQPPACLGWPADRYRFVAAMAGMLPATSDAALRRRLGAVSTLRGLRYWSVTESGWRDLIKDSSALASAQGPRRGDFTPEEMHSGAILHFVEEDNRSSSPVVYRLRVVESSAERIVVDTENVSPVESNMITLYPPGALRAAYILTKLDEREWGLYAVSASTSKASRLVSLAGESHANRARALFAHYAGTTLHAAK